MDEEWLTPCPLKPILPALSFSKPLQYYTSTIMPIKYRALTELFYLHRELTRRLIA